MASVFLSPADRPARSLAAVLSEIGDPEGTRTVTSIIALLVAVGLALLLVAIWLYRSTRPDPELLAPLEVMGERAWRRGDPVWQRRRLDELRPAGAKPLTPSAAPPEFDASFDDGPAVSGFDDLQAVRVAPPGGAEPPGSVVRDELDGRQAITPVELDRPALDSALDSVPDGDFDPDALAAARAELERELAEGSSRRSSETPVEPDPEATSPARTTGSGQGAEPDDDPDRAAGDDETAGSLEPSTEPEVDSDAGAPASAEHDLAPVDDLSRGQPAPFVAADEDEPANEPTSNA